MKRGRVGPALQSILYGAGEVPGTLAKTVVAILYMFYLTDIAGVEPAAAGFICMTGRIWGACTDVKVERTGRGITTRWGRWRPWFLFSALPLGGFFILLWLPVPAFLSTSGTFIHAVLFFLFMTALSSYYSPYYSLMREVSTRSGKASGIAAWRVLFSFVFGLAAAAVPKIIVDAHGSPSKGFAVAGIVSGAVITLSALLIFIVTSEDKPGVQKPEGKALFSEFHGLLKNRSFMCLLAVYAGSFAGINILEGFLLYYMKYWIGREGDMPILLVSVIVSSAATVPLWGFLCRRLGEKLTLSMGLLFWGATQTLWYVLTGGVNPLFIYGAGAVIGIGYGCVHVVPAMMQAGACDEEEFRTGHRREDAISGIINFITKIGNSLSFLVMGLVLHFSGYVPGAVQGPSTLSAIRYTMAFGPLAFILLAVAASFFYPSSDEK